MILKEITGHILDAAYQVDSALGPGLLENVYEACLLFELHRRKLHTRSQVELPVLYEGVRIDVGYRLDILVEDAVIVELKSVEQLTKLHHAQLLTYLKLSQKRVGLLINFNTVSLKDGIKRIIQGYDTEQTEQDE